MAEVDPSSLDFDELRERYARERERREQAGDRRYRDIADVSPDLISDPYTTAVPRDPTRPSHPEGRRVRTHGL